MDLSNNKRKFYYCIRFWSAKLNSIPSVCDPIAVLDKSLLIFKGKFFFFGGAASTYRSGLCSSSSEFFDKLVTTRELAFET